MIFFLFLTFDFYYRAGFNRSIPTNERYEMVGEASAGEHHLRVKNATLVDDADFQCQVGPADGHSAIRATGHLTVLSEYHFLLMFTLSLFHILNFIRFLFCMSPLSFEYHVVIETPGFIRKKENPCIMLRSS